MIQKKICILGAAGVGKTSLTAQFVYSKFSEQYLSTMGVKIDRKLVEVDDNKVNLMIWDIHGEEKFKKITTSYLKGASGTLTVIDGTRPETMATALEITSRVQQDIGDIPNIFLLNKFDLKDSWEISSQQMTTLHNTGCSLYTTSAKTGENVEIAFHQLASLLIAP